jgi:hypothetical protein
MQIQIEAVAASVPATATLVPETVKDQAMNIETNNAADRGTKRRVEDGPSDDANKRAKIGLRLGLCASSFVIDQLFRCQASDS